MSLVIKFYFTSSMLNTFQTLIHPSSGVCNFPIISPHWLCVLVLMCVGVSVWLGRGGIHVAGWSTTSDIKLVSYSSTITMMHSPIYIRFTTYTVHIYKIITTNSERCYHLLSMITSMWKSCHTVHSNSEI